MAGVTTLTSFAQSVTASPRDYHARMVSRPQSKFTHLTDAKFQEGPRRLSAAVERERSAGPGPVRERYDVRVLSLR